MEPFYERLMVRAATIDEILSDAFEPLPGQKGVADTAARRLAAWCRSCASGDWSLLDRRLQRDRWSIGDVLARFATVRRNVYASTPDWIEDAIWIEAVLQSAGKNVKPVAAPDQAERYPFEHLFAPAVERAEALLWAGIDSRVFDKLDESARSCLHRRLLKELCGLSAPAIYERFAKARKEGGTPADADEPPRDGATWRYDRFVAEMKAGGFRRLFEDKPVLLRLIATTTRQWIETSRELLTRLDADLTSIRGDLLASSTHCRVAAIEDELSDPHNGGHSVRILRFEDGSRVVYKPKDLRLDSAWQILVERLNRADPPVALKAVRAMTRDGYGWTEFIDHAGCADEEGCRRFFQRAGAWLALFHCFAGSDMHQENMIAAGDHPVPIDLEMILQAAAEERKSNEAEAQAFEAAMDTVSSSVMMVGLLPAYGKSPENNIFAVGGMISDLTAKTKLTWTNINSDKMRPAKTKEAGETVPNLPHIDGRYAKLGDHIEDFVQGFEDYAKFLMRQSRDATQGALFENFAGLPARKVIRPTSFYYMLLQRLKDHRTMDDGLIWSAQVDFLARMADWEALSEPLWPLQRAERLALVQLNVPHFVSPSDGNDISDAAGISVRTGATSGLDRARARVQNFDAQAIASQVAVIRQNTSSVSRSGQPAAHAEPKQLLRLAAATAPVNQIFVAEADRIAEDLTRYAVRRGPGAAWIGLDWLGDSEVAQLVTLGPDLYNGLCGIAVFLAAHAAVTGAQASEELARAAIAHLRKNLKSRNAARMARSLGIGGATGLGSIVYGLATIAKSLGDDDVLADALLAAELFTNDLIAADKQLDIIGGSAGAILGLLRLYRDSRSGDPLKRATTCGEHLLSQPRRGADGLRSWIGQGAGDRPLNGMSHGAAGYAYALASLAAATGREDFAAAASECIGFEDSSYDAGHTNWPDLRGNQGSLWPAKWCHGAPGIGLARIAMGKRGVRDCKLDSDVLTTDVRNALAGAERHWPGHVDTMCCGTLGSIEFFCEACNALGSGELRQAAVRRMMAVVETAAAAGDYRWNAGNRQFNPGLFRGLAGVGYTLLRLVDDSLPNVIIWD